MMDIGYITVSCAIIETCLSLRCGDAPPQCFYGSIKSIRYQDCCMSVWYTLTIFIAIICHPRHANLSCYLNLRLSLLLSKIHQSILYLRHHHHSFCTFPNGNYSFIIMFPFGNVKQFI